MERSQSDYDSAVQECKLTIELPVSIFAYPLAVLLCYWTCLAGEPIFDDHQIVANTRDFKWEWFWIRMYQRPLTAMSYALQKAWPNTMRGLHLGNAAIHCVNALIVERIAYALRPEVGFAFFCGLCFCVMPFAVNSVAYVTGRASILSATFGLLAAWSIVAGYGWLAIPLIWMATLAKEDGAGFGVQAVGLLLWHRDFKTAGVLAMGAIAVAFVARQRLADLYNRTGDVEMAKIHLPVAHPQPLNAIVVAVETVYRIPFWMLGFAQSPWHGSGIGFSWRRAACAVTFLAGGSWLLLRSF